MAKRSGAAESGPSHVAVEIGVAIAIAIFGIVTVIGSLKVGINWGAEGPKAGFFPFYVGLMIIGSGLVNLYQAVTGQFGGGLFASWGQLRQVMSVVVPTADLRRGDTLYRHLHYVGGADRFLHALVGPVRLGAGAGHLDRNTAHHLCGVRAVVPGPAAKGTDRGILGILGSSGGSGPRVVPAGRATRHGRNRKSVPRLCRRAAAVQHPADGDRHPARRHHRRLAGPGRRQRHRDPVAADLLDVADLGDHHAVLHLLGRAVRRRHHLGAVQYSRRAVVRCDDVRWLSDGAEGPGRRGAHRRVHLFVCRRAVCRHHDYAGRAAGRAVCVAIRARGKIRGLFPRVLQFHRHEQGAAGQDGGVDDDRLCARRRRPRSDDRQPAPDLRLPRRCSPASTS